MQKPPGAELFMVSLKDGQIVKKERIIYQASWTLYPLSECLVIFVWWTQEGDFDLMRPEKYTVPHKLQLGFTERGYYKTEEPEPMVRINFQDFPLYGLDHPSIVNFDRVAQAVAMNRQRFYLTTRSRFKREVQSFLKSHYGLSSQGVSLS